MRTPLSLAGAWYAAAMPNGEHAALYANGRIATSRGDIALPPGDQPLFLDAAEIDGQLCVGGQSHAGHGLLVWDGTTWRTPGVPAFGESPVAFGLDDEILSAAPGDKLAHYHLRTGVISYTDAALGVDGLRAVLEDGTIVRGNNTRADPARVIGEFTTWGDVTVGQSGYSCVALHGGKRYVLVTGAQPGGCRAIRFKRQGDRLAVAVHLPTEARTLLIWCTVAELAQFPEQSLTPPAPVPPLPEPPMATTPNLLDIATATAARHPDLVKANTTDACGRLTEYIVNDLHAADPGFGLLSKRPGEHQYNGHAVDATIYKPTQQVIDMMSGAGDRDPNSGVPANQQFDIRLRWNEVPKRDGNDWMEPVPVDGGTTPVPQPTPPPNVHMYDGGEHDTDECDICHRSRFDPVHIIPESTVKHAYNGGEQDTGLCDICQKPVGDPIHNTAPEPQEPPGGTPSPGGTVSFDDDATRLLTQILDSCHAQEERQAEIVAAIQELKDAVGSTGKSLTGEIVKNAPGIISAILPFLKGSAVKKPAAKRKRR